ncbi:MAG: type III secretion system export apparatus subunit SctR [Deltaproteobacteria bacterium]|nr:type III secretion system export apparatus subunit SctR [Deltaproteobacteria bacterium]
MKKVERQGKRAWLWRTVAFAATLSLSGSAAAQKVGDIFGKESITSKPLLLLLAITVLALVPFVLMMVTSFVKIAVVLSVVRQAIGTQQIPPTQVITGLAIILTVYIMMPVGLEVYHSSQSVILKEMPANWNIESITGEQVVTLARTAQEPMRNFLMKHAHAKDRIMFYKLALNMRQPRDRATLTDDDFAVVVPAFVISELKESFQIGFILFVPFLVIDMVVSNILMALGMQMLSPTTISLPFKILLFVLVDGWYLISRGLVLTYQ